LYVGASPEEGGVSVLMNKNSGVEVWGKVL
jgi:hypothetical protein